MKIFVCIKQVPDTETKIKISAAGDSIDTTGIKWVMNPYDEFAVEEAIKTRDANPGSQVWVVSVGPKKRTVESIRTALAMGADEGIAVDAPEYLDSYQTAAVLANCIKSEGGAKVIFAGKLAIDDNLGSVPQMLAEQLGVPHVSVVSKFSLTGDVCHVERDVDGGAKEVLETKTPVVLSANKGLNLPRYASLPGIMKAKKKVIKELDSASLGLESGKLFLNKVELPPEKPAAQILSSVSDLVAKLRDEAKVL